MIYLDHNATTPQLPLVKEALANLPTFLGNPGATQYLHGQEASMLLESTREEIAELLGLLSSEVIFTSSASEAAALSLWGLALSEFKNGMRRPRILVSPLEHKATLNTLVDIESCLGFEVRTIVVNQYGEVEIDDLEKNLDEEVLLVASMRANNETGSLNDLRDIYPLVKAQGALFVSDLTQAIGKVDSQLASTDVAFFSGHKIGAGTGAGVLTAKRHIQHLIASPLRAGNQERKLRGGTQNLTSIIGLRIALESVLRNREIYSRHCLALRQAFLSEIRRLGISLVVNAENGHSLPNTLNIRFPGVDAETLISQTPRVAFSSGSACNNGNPEPSHVLLALGLSPSEAAECVRLSFSTATTYSEVIEAANEIAQAALRIQLKA